MRDKRFKIALSMSVKVQDTGEEFSELNQSWSDVPYYGLLRIEERLLNFEKSMHELGRDHEKGLDIDPDKEDS